MRILFLILIFAAFITKSHSQNISELQKKKSEAAKEIEYTTRLLNEVQKNEKSSLGKLRLINSQINRRNTVISSINNEIQLYEEFAQTNEGFVKMLKNDIEELKAEYAELIRMSYKNKNTRDEVMFLLSADDLNQAYKRHLYLKRYTRHRQKQAKALQCRF